MERIKKLSKFWSRNPFFYKVRFKLLLTEIKSKDLLNLNYNKYNSKENIPKIFFEINEEIFKDEPADLLEDLEKAKKIASWLRTNIEGGLGLGIDSSAALRYMLDGGYGVCSDFCQIFNNFCVINDIRVREWGVNNMALNEGGHSFNEVYSKELKKWILLDVSKSVYFVEKKSKSSKPSPLSVVEVFTLSRLNKPKSTIFFNPTITFKKEKVKEYYYSKNKQPFLVDNYDNKFYDTILRNLNSLPVFITHGLAILLNKSYKFRMVKLPQPVS